MKIVGISACPTGIAHTYMVAEKLEKTAKSLGYTIKIETQGVKVENILSTEEIQQAEVVILAVDKEVQTDRFAGKKVKRVSTARAIREPEKVIQEAIDGVEVTTIAQAEHASNESGKKAGIYNHFMNGVNYMLPLVIAGGILIAFSFAFGINRD